MSATNPAGWPAEVAAIFERFVTCEWATLTKAGAPITWPVTPFLGEDRRTVDVSTGLTYPAKTERARRNPHVALLFSDPKGSGLPNPPTVLVQGLATVRDANLQANCDRYTRLALQKLPGAYKGQPAFMLRRQAWYFSRIWALITPLRILWWPGGQTDAPPQRWEAPAGTTAPQSDPAPPGPGPGAWQDEQAGGWLPAAERAGRLGAPVLTVTGPDGYPVPFRMRNAGRAGDGFDLVVPAGMPAPAQGPACLTFHSHAEEFRGQENIVFVGQAQPTANGAHFQVERVLPDFSLAGNGLQMALAFMRAAGRLNPRLRQEAARRGQPVPQVHLPKR